LIARGERGGAPADAQPRGARGPLLGCALIGRLRARGDARVLALAGSGALGLSLPIALAIVVLMIAVGVSYRQIIRAYPQSGGSYVVANENLGELPALITAAGLLIDYVLTVAVSISAGVAAITSAVPSLPPRHSPADRRLDAHAARGRRHRSHLAMGKTHCPQGFSQPACKNALPLCILTCRCLLEAVRKETNT
jgi:amino acid transporter